MYKFQPSINILYDFKQEGLLDRFVPNGKQLDIAEEIIRNVLLKDSVAKAHLLVGPYGAGKSMIGAVIANLMITRRNGRKITKFVNGISQIDETRADKLEKALKLKEKRWIPVPISTKNGTLMDVILSSVIDTLKEENITFHTKGEEEQILQVIKTWKNRYPDTFAKMEDMLQANDQNLDSMIAKLKTGDPETIAEFKRYYTLLTSGAILSINQNVTALEQVEFIAKQLVKQKIGLFITYDEFGRFLQLLDKMATYKAMQEMQDLAELANRLENLGLLFITHSGLRQYAEKNSFSKSELERVEKRFATYYLESDPMLFYRSAFKILEKLKEGGTTSLFLQSDVERYKIDISKYNLFSSMSPQEVDGAILEGCQPIHPLTIYLLPQLSNILGQNERTLYMFLSQFAQSLDETKWYYVDQLFDYFYSDDTLYYRIEELKYYRLAVSYNVSNDALRIVKLLTLLDLVSEKFDLDVTFVSFALGMDVENVQQGFDELNRFKLLRFNRIINSFELYAGSIHELDELVAQYRLKTKLNDESREALLKTLVKTKYFLPLTYNSEKSMTRFIEVHYSFGADSIDSYSKIADGNLCVLFADVNEEASFDTTSLSKDHVLYAHYPLELDSLVDKVDELLVIETMVDDKNLLKAEEGLFSELGFRKENLVFEVQQLLKPFEQFDTKKLTWYFRQQRLPGFQSKYELESFLSHWMSERFPQTLEVRNEGFNKHVVTKVQRKAAVHVLNQVLSSTSFEGIRFEGYGPDYLIYASILKNNRLNPFELENLEQPNLVAMRAALVEYVESNPRGNLLELCRILADEPFGTRTPIIPILVVSLLKDYWHQFSFYANGLFVEEMSAELLYSIVEQSATFYEFEFYDLGAEVRETIRNVNEIFFRHDVDEHPVFVFNKLRKWLRGLPRYTQIATNQSIHVLRLKELIRYSEVDPIDAANQLNEFCMQSGQELEDLKNELERFIEDMKFELEGKVRAQLGITEDFEAWKQQKDALLSSQRVLREMVQLMESGGEWIELLIKQIVGVGLTEWSDITLDSFWTSFNRLLTESTTEGSIRITVDDQTVLSLEEMEFSVKGKTVFNNLQRIVQASGRTMQKEEMKYILYSILRSVEDHSS